MQSLPLDEPGHCAGRRSCPPRSWRFARKDSDQRPVVCRCMNLSAVILAGGQSSRMGRDKARLEIGGWPLLARQIQLLRKVGVEEIFVSGRPDQDYAEFGCPVLSDRFAEAGPLAGIERALAEASLPWLLVVAVDMPN